jgi:hypothetical protein
MKGNRSFSFDPTVSWVSLGIALFLIFIYRCVVHKIGQNTVPSGQNTVPVQCLVQYYCITSSGFGCFGSNSLT